MVDEVNEWIPVFTAIMGSSVLSTIISGVLGSRARNAPASRMESWATGIDQQRALEEAADKNALARSYSIIARQVLVKEISKTLVPTPVGQLVLVGLGMAYFAGMGGLLLLVDEPILAIILFFAAIIFAVLFGVTLAVVEDFRTAVIKILDAAKMGGIFEDGAKSSGMIRQTDLEGRQGGPLDDVDNNSRLSRDRNPVDGFPTFLRLGNFILGPSPSLNIKTLCEELNLS